MFWGHGLDILNSKQGVLDQDVIKIGGRQRMLSQRTVLLAQRCSETGDARYRDLVSGSLETGHAWSLANAVPAGSDIEQHYAGAMGARLDAQSMQVADLAGQLLAEGAYGCGPIA